MFNSVRDGQRVVPTCPGCGCRLKYYLKGYQHFMNYSNQTDARGCKCKYLGVYWMEYNNFIGYATDWRNPYAHEGVPLI